MVVERALSDEMKRTFVVFTKVGLTTSCGLLIVEWTMFIEKRSRRHNGAMGTGGAAPCTPEKYHLPYLY